MNDMTMGSSPSANGQAYRVYLERTQVILSGLTVIDYYSAPLPSPVDEALADIVSAFTGWPENVGLQFIESLPQEESGLFAIFGHRAATWAIRESSPDWLRLGLIGNGIANYYFRDTRNVDASLAIFYHCARRLEMEPAGLFDDVAFYASEAMADHLRRFGHRPEVTLKQYGWREIRTAEGPRFKIEW